jgi:hypothetical protein
MMAAAETTVAPTGRFVANGPTVMHLRWSMTIPSERTVVASASWASGRTRQGDIVSSTEERFAYWDRECDIAWIPTGPSTSVVCEKTSWGLIDHDEKTDEVTGLEIWDASTVFPLELLECFPSPGRPDAAAA